MGTTRVAWEEEPASNKDVKICESCMQKKLRSNKSLAFLGFAVLCVGVAIVVSFWTGPRSVEVVTLIAGAMILAVLALWARWRKVDLTHEAPQTLEYASLQLYGESMRGEYKRKSPSSSQVLLLEAQVRASGYKPDGQWFIDLWSEDAYAAAHEKGLKTGSGSVTITIERGKKG